MKKWLITGGNGAIGAPLVKALVARGDWVRVLDDVSRGNPERLKGVHCEFFPTDITEPRYTRAACKGMDAVIHLAAVNGTRHFYERPGRVLEVACKGVFSLMDCCILEGIKEIHVASSSEVYQAAFTVPTPEDVGLIVPDPYNPRYSYAAGKIVTEMAALHYHPEHFSRVTIFRPHNVYGPDTGEDHAVPQIIRKVLQATPENPVVQLQGTGDETRAFCHIEDAVAGVLAVVDKGDHRGTYNVGVQEETRIAHLADLIAIAAGADYVQFRFEEGDKPQGSVRRRCPDMSKLRALGWFPKVPLLRGLEETVKWYREHPCQGS